MRATPSAPDAMGPGIEDFIAKERSEKADTRFSLSRSAVSTLPEYGYTSLDKPPLFSKRNTVDGTIGGEKGIFEGDKLTSGTHTGSHVQLTLDFKNTPMSDVKHAV